MRFEDVSVVLQGPVQVEDTGDAFRPTIHSVIASVRRHLPGARVIVSTWETPDLPDLGADVVVQSPDPGALPSLKKHTFVPNNVNRQIRSAKAGLEKVTTRYALKMRTDCLLTGHHFVELQRKFAARDERFAVFTERLLVANLYSINPRIFEELPFHPSDWFQFGLAEDVFAFWDCPFMTDDEATWFQRHEHRAGTTELNCQFNSRYGVEQFVFLNAVRKRLPVECDYLNDVRPTVLEWHDRVFANNLVIVEMPAAGFSFPKNDWASRSLFHRFNCYTHADWLWLYRRHSGGKPALPTLVPRLCRRFALGLLAWMHASSPGRWCFRVGVFSRIKALFR